MGKPKKKAPTKKQIREQKARQKYGRNREIFGMFRAGASKAQVAEHFGLGETAVKRLRRRFLQGDDPERRVGSGRKRKTTDRLDRRITKIARSEASPSLAAIQRELKGDDVTLSKRTIQRRLHETGNRRCVCAKKPWLSDANRIKRLKFAREHGDWTAAQWKKVIWSDESKFIFRYSGTKMVWRRVDEKHSQRCTTATVKGAQKSVMAWGAFRGKASALCIESSAASTPNVTAKSSSKNAPRSRRHLL